MKIMNSRLNYFVIYPPLIFFEERSTAFRSAEKQKNRKTPNGNSIGGFLFTFTRERVSRRNHTARPLPKHPRDVLRALHGRERVMFMHDAPLTINFAQTHRQAKFKRFTFPIIIDVNAAPYRRSESHVSSSSNVYIVKRERDWFLLGGKKCLPRRHVLIQAPR